MPNGEHEGQARAERYRLKYAQNQRGRANGLSALSAERELPPYEGDSDADITANLKGIQAKLGLPRAARMAIGIALAIVLVTFGVGAVVVAVVRLLP